MPGSLSLHSRCSRMHFPRVLQGTVLPAGPCSGWATFAGAMNLLCSQCHQKNLSPENDPAMAERVIQQMVQLPALQQVPRMLVCHFLSQYLGVHLHFRAETWHLETKRLSSRPWSCLSIWLTGSNFIQTLLCDMGIQSIQNRQGT